MSELTVTLLRFGFLALLWIFIFSIVASQGRDLAVGGKLPAVLGRSRAERRAAAAPPAPEPAAPPAAGPGTGQQRSRPQTLAVLEGPLQGRSYALGNAPVLLGRSPEATVPLGDDYASGRHARLFPQGSRWFLEDLGSTNGTFVGQQRLSRAVPLDAGTPFRVGKTVLELRS
ncbi:FHA domain-containing protein FhaB/FipA [Kocuria turfanensis]|uniref:FHA domain-containing protein FhaB/FipA n=1 Tax=Kocuria turfanensis TaxID=388357 RepID=UPI004035943E